VDDRARHPTIDETARRAARARQRVLLKPEGSLGRLEQLAVWLAGVSGSAIPEVRALIVVAAADHGVAEEGVSAYPQAVTAQMLDAFVAGGAAISVLARSVGAGLRLVDAGVATHGADDPRIVRTGLRPSANLVREPALTAAALVAGLEAGRAIARDAAAAGITVLVGGDMGIANTTPATCLAVWLTGRDPNDLCGRGTGVDDAGLARKQTAIARALATHRPHIDCPHEALRRVGGGELAVLCGLALGAASYRLAYICDGLIATAAAAVADAIDPDVRPRLLAGHRSPEPAHSALLEHLELEPLLDLGMRLGEASGAAVALSIVQLACALHAQMDTFADAGVAGREP
jgi:nicotinate-nucleotide--dimethylbenzimidazole phosphoribosyltransferase